MSNLCNQCPRNCNIDRTKNVGFCGENQNCKVAKVMLHHWEEPIISGTEQTDKKGSGTIFFSGCTLKCVYCQNYEISHKQTGKEYSAEQLANLFSILENKGATNINLVTPTHFTEQIISALKIYKPSIPVVWNTSGYEKAEQIAKLAGLVDIFLCDIKYCDETLSEKYSKCKNYFEKTCKAILQMKKNCPKDIIENGLMKQGLIVRHLVLPTHYKDSYKVLEWIEKNLGKDTIVSIMGQYTPCNKAEIYPEINRKLKPLEYNLVIHHAEKLGLDNCFVQELESASTDFIPDFSENEIEI